MSNIENAAKKIFNKITSNKTKGQLFKNIDIESDTINYQKAAKLICNEYVKNLKDKDEKDFIKQNKDAIEKKIANEYLKNWMKKTNENTVENMRKLIEDVNNDVVIKLKDIVDEGQGNRIYLQDGSNIRVSPNVAKSILNVLEGLTDKNNQKTAQEFLQNRIGFQKLTKIATNINESKEIGIDKIVKDILEELEKNDFALDRFHDFLEELKNAENSDEKLKIGLNAMGDLIKIYQNNGGEWDEWDEDEIDKIDEKKLKNMMLHKIEYWIKNKEIMNHPENSFTKDMKNNFGEYVMENQVFENQEKNIGAFDIIYELSKNHILGDILRDLYNDLEYIDDPYDFDDIPKNDMNTYIHYTQILIDEFEKFATYEQNEYIQHNYNYYLKGVSDELKSLIQINIDWLRNPEEMEKMYDRIKKGNMDLDRQLKSGLKENFNDSRINIREKSNIMNNTTNMRKLIENVDLMQKNRRLTEIGPYGNSQKAVRDDIETAVPGRRKYIPSSYATVTKRDTGDIPVEVYTYEMDGAPYAIMFGGRRAKPDKHYRYSNAERREEAIDEYLSAVMTSIERKERTKAEKNAHVTSLQEGDIMVSLWGYDQTNVDFYQIIEVLPSGKSVKIRPIEKKLDNERNQRTKHSVFMSDYVLPVPHHFTGPSMTKRIMYNDSLKITSYAYARKWKGNSVNQTSYA